MKMKNLSHNSIDQRILKMCKLIVKHIEEQPEKDYVQEALNRVRFFKKKRGNYLFYQEWEKILQQSFDEIKKVLLGRDEKSYWLRQSLPFQGILTDEERISLVLKSYGKSKRNLKKQLDKVHEFERTEHLV